LSKFYILTFAYPQILLLATVYRECCLCEKAGKPVGIYQHIGRRPILAFGNSDSDMQMIEYTMAGEGRRLGLFVHHTDGIASMPTTARATLARWTRPLTRRMPRVGLLWT
jgi:hypothetical protein